MRLLIDTSVLIKVLEDNPNLSARFRGYIADTTNEKWVSQYSFMELVIKMKIGKLSQLQLSAEQIFDQAIADGFLLLPVSNAQILGYSKLPLFEDHRDPFDRFIVAAALTENMKIVSTDKQFQLYKNYVDIL